MVRFFIVLIAISALLLTKAVAQKGVFDVRLSLKKVDCTRQKLFVDVEIKSHDETTEFLMGNANFRFVYNARFLQSPVLSEQHNFSSVGENPNFNYNPQSLNGSSERGDIGIVSLNIIYTNVDEKTTLVSSQGWTPIATIQFDLVNPQALVGTTLAWNDHKTFPVTGLSEVVLKKNTAEVATYIVKSSGVFKNLTINSMTSICNSLGSNDTGELMIPEGFSPNGDGVNDRFVLYHLGSLKADVMIYNQYGRIVYANSNYQNDWDGQTEQGSVADGTYFYTIRLSDGRTFSRSMTISR